jgi:GH24 family phage-related lysozyme (muramidase)
MTASLEGRVLVMYTDVKNLVTTGCGILIDPIECALPLPWIRLADGAKASAAEIEAEWRRVKTGGFAELGYLAAQRGATIALSPASVDALTLAKMRANDTVLARRFRGWEDLPSDAQLGVHSLAWALGPRFAFPRFEVALVGGDWATCAEECTIDVLGNPGIVRRNEINRALFLSAASGDPALVNGWGPKAPPSTPAPPPPPPAPPAWPSEIATRPDLPGRVGS